MFITKISRCLFIAYNLVSSFDLHTPVVCCQNNLNILISNPFQGLVKRQMELEETDTALKSYRRRVGLGDLGSPTAHISHAHHPEPPVEHRRMLELWAAVSGALALLAFGYLLIYRPPEWLLLAILVGVAFGFIDSLARGRSDQYLISLTIVLALVNGVILFIEWWQITLILTLVLLVLFMLRDNLRELF